MEDVINESQSGIVVEKVQDTNAGVLEVSNTEENTFIINSIEDLVFFAFDVTNGNTYEGKTVELGTSLDFNSSKSYVDAFRKDYGQYGYDGELKSLLTSGEGFKSIGITTGTDNTKSFVGTFNGNNNSIYNLYININSLGKGISNEKRGLFALNYGTITNLYVLSTNIYLKTDTGSLAAIAAQNATSGNINNCVVSGNVKNESTYGSTGGVTGSSNGMISNCKNSANINISYNHENYTGRNVGGICAGIGESGKVECCFNIGSINGSNESGTLYIGGILGSCEGNKVNNCYNGGMINGNAKILNVGGIVGYNSKTISNCYNYSNVVGNATDTLYKGMIVGRNANAYSIDNCYYQKYSNQDVAFGNVDDLGNMNKTAMEMKDGTLLNLLNTNNIGIWKADVNNINKGYPILNWQ